MPWASELSYNTNASALQMANTIFGGTAEYVALWFKQQGMESGFYWYVTAMIGLSLITYLRMRDTQKHSLIVED